MNNLQLAAIFLLALASIMTVNSETSLEGCTYTLAAANHSLPAADQIGLVNTQGSLAGCLAACDAMKNCTAVIYNYVSGLYCQLYQVADVQASKVPNVLYNAYERQNPSCGTENAVCVFSLEIDVKYTGQLLVNKGVLNALECQEACLAEPLCRAAVRKLNNGVECNLMSEPLIGRTDTSGGADIWKTYHAMPGCFVSSPESCSYSLVTVGQIQSAFRIGVINPEGNLDRCLSACDSMANCTDVSYNFINGLFCFPHNVADLVPALVKTTATTQVYRRQSMNCGTENAACVFREEVQVSYSGTLLANKGSMSLIDCTDVIPADIIFIFALRARFLFNLRPRAERKDQLVVLEPDKEVAIP